MFCAQFSKVVIAPYVMPSKPGCAISGIMTTPIAKMSVYASSWSCDGVGEEGESALSQVVGGAQALS